MTMHTNTTSSMSAMTGSGQEHEHAPGAAAEHQHPSPPTAEGVAQTPPTPSQAAAAPPKLYFAYGSNLSLAQMATRCPASKFTSMAVLRGWKWIIGPRGYANIVLSGEKNDDAAEEEDIVFGMLYVLDEKDEQYLDIAEGVPNAYVKVLMDVEIPPGAGARGVGGEKGGILDQRKKGKGDVRKALVYVDQKRPGEGVCKDEYVARINRGVKDALENGMEEWYVRKYIRPFVPEGELGGFIRDPFDVRGSEQ